MKPLDLTKPVQTRDGFPVEIISTKGRGPQPVLGYIGGSALLEEWHLDGRAYLNSHEECHRDLINVPENLTVELWLNVTPGPTFPGLLAAFGSMDAADESESARRRIACLHIVKEFTVGEGL